MVCSLVCNPPGGDSFGFQDVSGPRVVGINIPQPGTASSGPKVQEPPLYYVVGRQSSSRRWESLVDG